MRRGTSEGQLRHEDPQGLGRRSEGIKIAGQVEIDTEADRDRWNYAALYRATRDLSSDRSLRMETGAYGWNSEHVVVP